MSRPVPAHPVSEAPCIGGPPPLFGFRLCETIPQAPCGGSSLSPQHRNIVGYTCKPYRYTAPVNCLSKHWPVRRQSRDGAWIAGRLVELRCRVASRLRDGARPDENRFRRLRSVAGPLRGAADCHRVPSDESIDLIVEDIDEARYVIPVPVDRLLPWRRNVKPQSRLSLRLAIDTCYITRYLTVRDSDQSSSTVLRVSRLAPVVEPRADDSDIGIPPNIVAC